MKFSFTLCDCRLALHLAHLQVVWYVYHGTLHFPVYIYNGLPPVPWDSVEFHALTNFSLHMYMSPFSPKGYSVPKAFIAAQSPMTNTKGDFWELVWQFHTPTIVLLTNFNEGKQVRVYIRVCHVET